MDILITSSKYDSCFLYHTLESNEGLCTYTTLPFKEGDERREILARTEDDYMAAELLRLLDFISSKLEIEIKKL